MTMRSLSRHSMTRSPPGTVTVAAVATGYSAKRLTDVDVPVNGDVLVDIALDAGGTGVDVGDGDVVHPGHQDGVGDGGAVDGDGDGKRDLWQSNADVIASVANYLKHHGWKPGMTRQQQYQVILKYNYSKPYANTILDIAARLRDG